MYILGRTQMIPTDSYEDAVRRIMAKGFDGVEIGIYNRNFEIRESFFEEDFPERMKACMAENGVKAYSVGAHMDYTESDEKLQAILKAVGVATKLGAKQMIINGAIRKEELPYEEQWDKFIADTKLICAEAERQNVYLAMEFEPGFVADNTEKMLKAFKEIHSPLLKFFFPLKTSEIPPANPPAIPATPFTSETAFPAITATTSSAICIFSPDTFSFTSSLFKFCSSILLPPKIKLIYL